MATSAAPGTLLTADERGAIERAVAAVESRTSAEIVPLVVATSDDYGVAYWKAAAGGALAVAAVELVAGPAVWGWGDVWVGRLAPLLGALGAALAVQLVPPWRRLLVGGERLERRLAQRAFEAFVRHEVFRTRDRTGILIFVSLFERRLVVLADEGIHRRTGQDTWRALADEVAAGLGRGEVGATLVSAVERCGAILEQHGFPRRPDDRNELPDAPRAETD